MAFLRKYGIGLSLLISWVIQAYPLVTLRPDFAELVGEVQKVHKDATETFRRSGAHVPSNISEEVPASAASEGLKQEWQAGIMFIVLGIGSSIFALFQIRYWRWLVILASAMYLLVWCSSGSLSAVSPIEAMELKWMAAKVLHLEASFFLKDVALPFFYAFILVFLFYRIFRPAAAA